MTTSIKQKIGALIFDIPIYVGHLLLPTKKKKAPAWVLIKNRREKLHIEKNRVGVKCDWQWTSNLYLPKVYPEFGYWLYRKAFQDFPISFNKVNRNIDNNSPQVSFIIGHRGLDRLPLLLKTIDSISGQQNCSIECIVIEQDTEQLIKSKLPNWVTYIFSPLPKKNVPYSRSKAFNDGAIHAKAECLIFHDNDLLVPECYANEICCYFTKGYEFINLKRFIFYVTKESTKNLLNKTINFSSPEIEMIMQNAEGGGSIGASKAAFFEIGGFDNRFVGWGGEDNEFWERAQTRKHWSYSFLPLIHLWHVAQTEKNNYETSKTKKLYLELNKQSAIKRIEQLIFRKKNE